MKLSLRNTTANRYFVKGNRNLKAKKEHVAKPGIEVITDESLKKKLRVSFSIVD